MRLRNIRAFIDTGKLNFNNSDGIPTKTTLLLGENSAGKSTLLRCIGLASLGSDLGNQIERRPPSFLRANTEKGFIEVEFALQLDESVTHDTVGKLIVGLEIRAGENSFRPMAHIDLSLGNTNAVEGINWLRRRTNDYFGLVMGYGAQRGLSENPSALNIEEPVESVDRLAPLFRGSASLIDPDLLGKMLSGDISKFQECYREDS